MGQALQTMHYLDHTIQLEDLPLLDQDFDLFDDPDISVFGSQTSGPGTYGTMADWKTFMNYHIKKGV